MKFDQKLKEEVDKAVGEAVDKAVDKATKKAVTDRISLTQKNAPETNRFPASPMIWRRIQRKYVLSMKSFLRTLKKQWKKSIRLFPGKLDNSIGYTD